MVIPEIGLDDEPITPVIRELTVTNRNPNRTIMHAADQPAVEVGGDQVRRGDREHQAERAQQDTTAMGRSRLGPRHAAAPRPSLPERRSRRLPVTEADDQRQCVEHAEDAARGHGPGADVADVLAARCRPALISAIRCWPGGRTPGKPIAEVGDHRRRASAT